MAALHARGSSRVEAVRAAKSSSIIGSLAGATIETSMGTFKCLLFDQEAPITVANFAGLALPYVLDKINKTQTGAQDRPVKKMTITSVKIVPRSVMVWPSFQPMRSNMNWITCAVTS